MENKAEMNNSSIIERIAGWIIGTAVLTVGILNLFLVHPVPGTAYLLLSLIYFPPANKLLKKLTGFSVPLVVKTILGIILFLFTFGVSDLGDMLD